MPQNQQENKNIHSGSEFDDFLKKEGIFEHCQAVGKKYAFLMLLQEKKENMSCQKKDSQNA